MRTAGPRRIFAAFVSGALFCAAAAVAAIAGQTLKASGRQPAPPDGELFLIFERGKIGYIDRAGRIVIPPQFESGSEFYQDQFAPAQHFSEGKAAALRCFENGKCAWGFVDSTGAFAILPVYENARQFSGGLAAVRAGGKWGYVGHGGALEIAPQFVEAGQFENLYAAVIFSGGRRALVDRRGKILRIPRGVQDFGAVSENLIPVKMRGKWGFMDTRGRVLIRPRFEAVTDDSGEDEFRGEFSTGLAAVRLKGKWGYVDRTGRFFVAPKFHRAEAFQKNGVAVVSEGFYNWGLLGRDGRFVSAQRFESIHAFSEGLAAAQIGNKWGFIDREGGWIIPPAFEQVGAFSEGLAAARVGGKWGYIDRAGKFVIEPQFDSESYFRPGGLAFQMIRPYAPAAAGTPGQWGYIDRAGKYVWKSAG